jgi:hypothetical protein
MVELEVGPGGGIGRHTRFRGERASIAGSSPVPGTNSTRQNQTLVNDLLDLDFTIAFDGRDHCLSKISPSSSQDHFGKVSMREVFRESDRRGGYRVSFYQEKYPKERALKFLRSLRDRSWPLIFDFHCL